MPGKETVLEDALKLNYEEKVELVRQIWDDIAEQALAVPLSPEQESELNHLLEKYGDKPSVGTPWPEFREKLLRRRSCRS